MTAKNTNSRLCTDCGVRKVGTGFNSGFEEVSYCIEQKLCLPCGNEGQVSIAHENGHEGISEDDCWYCHPELDPRDENFTPRTGHTNTAAKTYKSHAGCKHAVTPAERAKCRKAGGPKAPTA